MIFNTLIYFVVFLLPSALGFRFAPLVARPWLCALSGSLFFIYFSLTMVGGLAGALCLSLILWQSVCCVYWCKPGSRLCWLWGAQSILILFVFKYYNFFAGTVSSLSGMSVPLWKRAFLPLGISFFTFEFLHFIVDRYKGKITEARLGDFLAFVLYFPTMVAGPIKRFPDFVPKLTEPRPALAADFQRGITRILYGLFKKFAIADLISAMTNHLNGGDILQAQGRGVLLLWLLAYGVKIYCDFSAYSDIAIGSARLFGIVVPENFDAPYARINISRFWQHWHISLYRWLFDYIYIPLGGSRVSAGRTYLNLVAVMLASGIWHGAGLNFLAWGAWHAFLLCLHRLWSQLVVRERVWESLPVRAVSWLLTLVSVLLGWAFFAMSMPDCLRFFQRLIYG